MVFVPQYSPDNKEFFGSVPELPRDLYNDACKLTVRAKVETMSDVKPVLGNAWSLAETTKPICLPAPKLDVPSL